MDKKIMGGVICIVCLSIVIIIFFVATKAFNRGFYCNDESLMYPYLQNTIPRWVVGFVGIVLPTLAILIIGRKHHRLQNQDPLCYCMLQEIYTFYFGVGLTQLTTDIAKYSIGRLSPHFLTVCKPNITCTTGLIIDNICLGTDTKAIENDTKYELKLF